jgi:stage V sporulation protein B
VSRDEGALPDRGGSGVSSAAAGANGEVVSGRASDASAEAVSKSDGGLGAQGSTLAAGSSSVVLPAGSPSSPAPAAMAGGDGGRHAGRGGLAVSAAKVYFILAGLVQQVALKAVLGLEGYGALSSALAAASIVYNPLVGASIQGVSHAVATAPEGARGMALRRALSLHAVLALSIGTVFWCAAPLIGVGAAAEHIVPSLRVLSTVLVLYGLYAPLVGALNGQTRFGTQAALDALAATLRSLGLIGGAFWFARSSGLAARGAEGAAIGFMLSSLSMLLVALGRVGVGQAGGGGIGVRRYWAFVGPILLGQVLLNLLFQADQLLLRRFAADAALAAGLDTAAADRLVGAYRAMQLFCFLPYQLVLSVSIVIFPMVARAHRARDRALVAAYVRQGMRIALLVSGLIVSVTAGLPGPLLELVFGADTAALAAAPMRWLALGLGNLALFAVLTAVLNSIEQQRLGLIVTALAFAFVVVACLLRVRDLPFGPMLLQQTAWATSLALLVATGVAMLLVLKTAGAVLAPASLLRVLSALAGALATANYLPATSALRTFLASLVVAASYVLGLILLGELGKDDLRTLRRIAGRA